MLALDRIERTLFILDWLQNIELRRRVYVGLNKDEVRNALSMAVFTHWFGEKSGTERSSRSDTAPAA